MLAYTLRPALPEDAEFILALLETAQLPTADLTGHWWQDFFVAIGADGEVIGVMGLQTTDHWGLVRSAVIDPEFRSAGIGAELLTEIENRARTLDVRELGLITTTAEAFFQRHGYRPIDRTSAPALMRDTAEFRELCPDSATIMAKSL